MESIFDTLFFTHRKAVGKQFSKNLFSQAREWTPTASAWVKNARLDLLHVERHSTQSLENTHFAAAL